MEKRKITLAELETEARVEEERKIAEAEAHASAEAIVLKEAEADLAADVSDWLSDTVGLDPASVLSHLDVSLNPCGSMASCTLALDNHVPITWDMVVKEEGLETQGRNPYRVCDLHHATLAGALLRSSDEWAAQKERQERVADQEASETASWEAHKQGQIAQGQHYLDLIASYPILGPILEMLAIYVGNMQEYENDMAAAEEYSKEIAAQMAAKMRTAQAQARELADEVDRAKSAQREAEERARRSQ
jgi:hypothetical protein